MHSKYNPTPVPMGPREDRDTVEANRMGVQLVAPTFGYFATITPDPAALGFPTDGISVATDGTVTMASADDPTTSVVVTLKSGQIHNISASKVTASTAGAVVGWWHRKPAAP